MGKTLIAELPPMRAADLAEFEETVRPWGLQRSQRRKQLQVASLGAAAGGVFGWVWPKARRNTALVRYMMVAAFGTGGAILGHTAGINIFPSVASNEETTLVKRMWWANKCAGNFDYTFDKTKFAEQYPNINTDFAK